MNFLELVNTRKSVRAYRNEPVPRETISRCIEAARLAPSACNAQPWHFVAADDSALCLKVGAAAHTPLERMNLFAAGAPVIVALVAEPPTATVRTGALLMDRQYTLIDIGIAAEHFCLQAAEEGLGTCMLGWFDEPKVKRLLGIPMRKRIGLLITLGFSAESGSAAGPDRAPAPKRRKSLETILSWNRYRASDKDDGNT